MAGKDRLLPCEMDPLEMAAKRASPNAKLQQGFWPGTETGENVSRLDRRPGSSPDGFGGYSILALASAVVYHCMFSGLPGNLPIDAPFIRRD